MTRSVGGVGVKGLYESRFNGKLIGHHSTYQQIVIIAWSRWVWSIGLLN